MKKRGWLESVLPIKGANRLGFTKPIVVQGLVQSRKTTGEEIASNALLLLKLKAGDILVDLGCGPGLVSVHMLSSLGQEGKLICVDASAPMLESAIGFLPAGNVELIHGDIQHISSLIPRFSVDGAILSGNLHLLTNKSLAFSQIKNILKLNGRLVVITHIKYSWDRGQRDIFPRLVSKALEDRPDTFPDGLRLPILTETELEQCIRIINQCGFNIQAYENDSWSGDTAGVLGSAPDFTVRERLKILAPNAGDSDVEKMVRIALEDMWSGRTAQVYLLCMPDITTKK